MRMYHDIMTDNSGNRRRKVAEPVQVYLEPADRTRLDWLTDALDTTKSDVLRRALEALERQIGDPEAHPALRIMKIAEGVTSVGAPGYDVAAEHDRFLADSEEASWRSEEPRPAPAARGQRITKKRG